MVDHAVAHRCWQVIYPGVYALTMAPLSQQQRWLAATLTEPGTFLSHGSASACWGIGRWVPDYETAVRVGNGGPQRFDGLLVRRSCTLAGETTSNDGIPITTVPRTLIDRSAQLYPKQAARMLREALRLKLTSTGEVARAAHRHRRRPGTPLLLQLATRYSGLPYDRTRSDAEALALEILHDAEFEPPLVNVKIGGEEADLVWPRRHYLVEIDGPQWHQFSVEDRPKEAAWTKAGFTFRRLPSDAVYEGRAALLAAAHG